MAEVLTELQERGKTDRRLSFGLYLVFLLVVIVLSVFVGVIAGVIAEFGTGKIISTVVSLLVAIYIWWYNWLLYKRRNEHFDRTNRLKRKLSSWIKEKFDTEMQTLVKADPVLDRREAPHSNLLFSLWLIFSYLGNLSSFHWALGFFGIPALVLGLVVLYYLTMDYYYHEQGEVAFFGRMAEIFSKKQITFPVTLSHPLHRRSYGLYIFLSIITLGIFGIYWAYVIFRDPNQHFDSHDLWESELEKIIEKT